MDFIAHLNNLNLSYNYIQGIKSAVVGILKFSSNIDFNKDPLVQKVSKGIYEGRPVLSKYNRVWDKKQLLGYFNKLPLQLPLPLLTRKAVTLLALATGGQRAQTINLIKLANIKQEGHFLTISIDEKVKQSRPGWNQPSLQVPMFQRKRCCVASILM